MKATTNCCRIYPNNLKIVIKIREVTGKLFKSKVFAIHVYSCIVVKLTIVPTIFELYSTILT